MYLLILSTFVSVKMNKEEDQNMLINVTSDILNKNKRKSTRNSSTPLIEIKIIRVTLTHNLKQFIEKTQMTRLGY